MPNWFNNLMGSVTQVQNVASGGIATSISGVFGGITGGLTSGLTGGNGVAGGSSGGVGAQGLISGIFTGNTATGSGGGLNTLLGTLGNSQLGANAGTGFGNYLGGQMRDNPSASGTGFFSNWNKPKTWQFWVIWVGIPIGAVLLIFGIYKLFAGSKSKPRKRTKRRSGGRL